MRELIGKGIKMFSNRHLTEEHKTKLRIAQLGRHHTKETKAKMSISHLGKGIGKGRPHTKESRAKMSLSHTGTSRPKEVKAKMSHSLRIAMKVLWQTPEYRDKIVKAMRSGLRVHPNKPEQKLMGLIENICPNKWAFVGSGQLVIGGKNPDFANINGSKQLIEVWGDYWHKGQNPQERIDLFKQYGYETLIIWESELKQPQEVISRLIEYLK